MTPSFALEGGLALAVARGLSVAALLSVFGGLVFDRVVAPRAFARMPAPDVTCVARRLGTALHVTLAVYGCATLAWLVLQAADMADATGTAAVLKAVPVVLSETTFGHLIGLQLAGMLCVTLAMIVLRPAVARPAALALVTVVVALQAGHGHAASMDDGPNLLLACDVAHLLGAGGWLGGLLPLLLLVGTAPPAAGAVAARWFSPMGKLCVLAVAISAMIQGWIMVGSVPGLVGTAYGWVAIAKVVLLAVLLGFAAANRYRFAPSLLRHDPQRARRVLVGSIAVQSCFGLAVIAAAIVLSSLPPAMHVEPLWPFARRFSLVAIAEDADFRAEVLWAALALAAAAALLVAATLVRRARWPAVMVAALIAWFAAPHFDLLLVQAYPTSYYRSPTNFAAASIVAGAALYPSYCAACHGADGTGNGPAASGLTVPPADLTAAHLWMHSDGELFWWLAHGMDAPSGGLSMPGFASVLSTEELWTLIDYIRAHNAGATMRGTHAWSPPVRAPAIAVTCNGKTLMLDDLRGQFVRLAIGTVPARTGDTGEALTCALSDPAGAQAYAIVAGIAGEELARTQFLIDDRGYMRALQLPGTAESWSDPKVLAAAIEALRAHPVAASSSDAMDMPM